MGPWGVVGESGAFWGPGGGLWWPPGVLWGLLRASCGPGRGLVGASGAWWGTLQGQWNLLDGGHLGDFWGRGNTVLRPETQKHTLETSFCVPFKDSKTPPVNSRELA